MRQESFPRLTRLFFAVFGLVFGAVLIAVTLFNFQYGFSPLASLALLFGFTALLWLAYGLLKRGESFFQRFGWLFCAAFLLGSSLLQIFIGVSLRYTPAYDLEAIYGGGIYWSEHGTFSTHEGYMAYLHRYPNNLGGAWLFMLYTNLTTSLGVQDHYTAAVVLNTLAIQASAFLVYDVLRRTAGAPAGLWGLLALGVFAPFYYMSAAFYTDALTLPFPILAVDLFLLAQKQPKRAKRLGLYALIGLALAAGTILKATVAIMLVAVALYLLLAAPAGEEKHPWQAKPAGLAALLLAFALSFGGYTLLVKNRVLDQDRLARDSYPFNHWVAMGLQGDGGYNDPDENRTEQLPGYGARLEGNWQTIKERLSTAGLSGLGALAARKAIACFGDGSYELYLFLDDDPANPNILHEFVLPEGKYYPLYRHLSQGLYLAIFLLALVPAWRAGFGRTKTRPYPLLLPWLALFGLLAFLLLWETNARYTMNFMPVLLACGGIGMAGLPTIARRGKRLAE